MGIKNDHSQRTDLDLQQNANRLLATVYEELRDLAARKFAQEKPGQTLQATALVHEAWLRLVGTNPSFEWDSQGHFFSAAAEAMRRILIEQARRKDAKKRGGDQQRISLDVVSPAVSFVLDEPLDFDDALQRLAEIDPLSAELVKLRVFTGITVEEAADILKLPHRTAYRNWDFAKAWLYRDLNPSDEPPTERKNWE